MLDIRDVPSSDLRASDVWKGKFDWSGYLQRHLTSPSVIVSRLHPIFGLRLAALFIYLTNHGLASDTPGEGTFQILSAVRLDAHQWSLWNSICKVANRCRMVAHPTKVHGVDSEGTPRQGSNHQPQEQKWLDDEGDPVEVGYAVDIRNTRGGSAAAWAPLHKLLPRYGLDWPLKGNPLERWHIEWFPRSRSMPIEGTVKSRAWPKRPGVHRPLRKGHRGGDVANLQDQLNSIADLDINLKVDGVFGQTTANAVKATRSWLGKKAVGWWRESHQKALEAKLRAQDSTLPDGWGPLVPPAPLPAPPPEPVGADPKADLEANEERLRAVASSLNQIADQFTQAREDLP